jgi:hypothetical protein
VTNSFHGGVPGSVWPAEHSHSPWINFRGHVTGELIHFHLTKLACFRKVDHRITDGLQQGRSAGVGYDRLHLAIYDPYRLAYVDVLADEQQGTTIVILSRALTWFNGHGVE